MKRKNILHFDMYYYHRISQIPGTYLLAGCFLSDTIKYRFMVILENFSSMQDFFTDLTQQCYRLFYST